MSLFGGFVKGHFFKRCFLQMFNKTLHLMKKIFYAFLILVTFNIAKAQETTINAVLANPCAVLPAQGFNNSLDFTVYPNPSNGLVNIEIHSLTTINNTKIAVYDMKGLLVYESITKNNNTYFIKSLPLQSLSSGIYLLLIISNQERLTKKLIINK